MTAPHPGEPPAMARPSCTPAAIRTVLAANADPGTLRRYDADLDAAFEQARVGGDLTPLLETVRRWWFEADTWRDPAVRRDYQARVSRYLTDGLPPQGQRVTRAQVRERYGVSQRVPLGTGRTRRRRVRRLGPVREEIPRRVHGRRGHGRPGRVPAPAQRTSRSPAHHAIRPPQPGPFSDTSRHQIDLQKGRSKERPVRPDSLSCFSRDLGGQSQDSPSARSVSPGWSVRMASRAVMIFPVSFLVRR